MLEPIEMKDGKANGYIFEWVQNLVDFEKEPQNGGR
jgi:hypothetical protein